jgi:hypothetical protein
MSEASLEGMGGELGNWDRERECGSPLARVALDILTAPGEFYNCLILLYAYRNTLKRCWSIPSVLSLVVGWQLIIANTA